MNFLIKKLNKEKIFEQISENFISYYDNFWDLCWNLHLIICLLTIISSISMLLVKNPIHSILFLIFVFLNISILWFLLYAEYIAILLIIIYAGAVSILFLFILLMVNIHVIDVKDTLMRYVPLSLIILFILILLSILLDLININGFSEISSLYVYKSWLKLFFNIKSYIVLSNIYNYFVCYFILSSLILLVALIGAIVLTLNTLLNAKKQEYFIQNVQNTSKRIKVHF